MNPFKKKNMQNRKEEPPLVDNEKTSREAEQAEREENGGQHFTEGLPDAEHEEQSQVAKLELEVSEAKDKLLRLYSEFDNYKKRVLRERIDLIKTAGADILLSMLP